ncbi:hypothetical protein ACWCQK_39895 [Streptomyces sp. NPDC002306]
MEGHLKVASQRPAGVGGCNTRRRAVRSVVDGRQVAFPLRGVQDRDQEHEPVVDCIAVPERFHCCHTAGKSCGPGCEGGEVQRIGRRALYAVAESLVSRVDHPLGFVQADPQGAQRLPDGPDRRQSAVAQHVSIDLTAGPFTQVGPPAAHWATSRDLRVRVMGSNVRQDSVPAPDALLVVLSNLVNIPPWSRGLPAARIGVEVLSDLVDKATRSVENGPQASVAAAARDVPGPVSGDR